MSDRNDVEIAKRGGGASGCADAPAPSTRTVLTMTKTYRITVTVSRHIFLTIYVTKQDRRWY